MLTLLHSVLHRTLRLPGQSSGECPDFDVTLTEGQIRSLLSLENESILEQLEEKWEDSLPSPLLEALILFLD